jgi:zinc carboxypeptidase
MNLKKLVLLKLIVLLSYCSPLYSTEFDMDYFFDLYNNYRSVPKNLMLMKHDHVVQELNIIKMLNNSVKVEQVGNSVENRSINLVSFGKGETKVLLWSQMHGDEPTATAALLAMYKYFADNLDNPFVQQLHKKLSLHSLIMLNPDGAERFQRRNAYDIDINRDANMLQTPEGKILKSMQERIKPDFGFNLHNMGGRETVEGTNKILKIALMAPPYNKENEDNLTRINAKKVTVQIKAVLDKYINGHVGKYKADYMPRAFGDAMQYWGVSTVLVETGSSTGDNQIFLEKLNFVSLLSVFDVLAENGLKNIDEKKYDEIPLEGKRVFDLLIQNVLIVNGLKSKPFIGDVGINVDYKLKKGKIDTVGYIKDIGDLSIFSGKKEIKGDNLVLTPGFISIKDNNLNIKKLHEQGITTIVDTKEELKNQNKFTIQKGKIKIEDIPGFTSLMAEKYKLPKKGKIIRNNKADLLLFLKDKESFVEIKNLQYLIVNGDIKKTQE